MSELRIRAYADRTSLDAELATHVQGELASAIEQRGQALLVASGGSTPVGFFKELATRSLDWSKVTVTLADERWVDVEHEDSNAGLLRRTLLQGPAAAATLIPLYTGDPSPEEGEAAIERQFSAIGPFDIVILGMGGDGHTASLFPQTPALTKGLDLDSGRACIAVHPPHAPHARMTLTLPRLVATQRLILHIAGEDKREVLERAWKSGNAMQLPIAAVLASDDPVTDIYWAP